MHISSIVFKFKPQIKSISINIHFVFVTGIIFFTIPNLHKKIMLRYYNL